MAAFVSNGSEDIASWWLRQRMQLEGAVRLAFDSLLLLLSWIIWKERNSRTFRNVTAGLQELRQKAVREADDWMKAGFKMLSVLALYWSHNVQSM